MLFDYFLLGAGLMFGALTGATVWNCISGLVSFILGRYIHVE